MEQRSGCFSVQSCQGRSEWPCCHGCLPPHPSSPGCRWVLGSRCGAGPGHRCCLPCHGWAVCCQGALDWLKLPTAPVEGAPRPVGQKPAREEGSGWARCPSRQRDEACGETQPRAARESRSCRGLALAPSSKGSCSAGSCVQTSSKLPPRHGRFAGTPRHRHGPKSPHFRGHDKNGVLHASPALW